MWRTYETQYLRYFVVVQRLQRVLVTLHPKIPESSETNTPLLCPNTAQYWSFAALTINHGQKGEQPQLNLVERRSNGRSSPKGYGTTSQGHPMAPTPHTQFFLQGMQTQVGASSPQEPRPRGRTHPPAPRKCTFLRLESWSLISIFFQDLESLTVPKKNVVNHMFFFKNLSLETRCFQT